MEKRATDAEIRKFLETVKTLLTAGRYDFVPRRKNMQSLATYGLTIKDVKYEILSLTLNHYYKGPKQDLDPSKPGAIWEFKKTIESTVFYIKIKVVRENNKDIVKCLGFHKDDYI